MDIAGRNERVVAETGPIRELRRPVAPARELGAVAYVPSIDRSRPPFVERAAEAGGLSPEAGVLTPEMARRVLRDKAEREARWQRAMMLWENIPREASEAEAGALIEDLLRRGPATLQGAGSELGDGANHVGRAFQPDRPARSGWKA